MCKYTLFSLKPFGFLGYICSKKKKTTRFNDRIMKNSPLISIITPVYNVEQYLRQCIESIIAQSFQDWELLLVDDGSIDNSGSICDEYAARDSRIRVLHKENTGQADSRNIALSMASADLIGFVDSDDWVEPDMYELLYLTMMENQADISICGYFRDYKDESLASCNENDVVIYNGEESLRLILEDKIIKSFSCDKLFCKNVITEPFPKSYFYEDYATLFKWFVGAKKVVFARIAKYHYRQRRSSTSNDGDPQKNYHFFVAELERFAYLQSQQLLSDRMEEFACKLIKIGLKQAKDIAKYSNDYSASFEFLLKIREKLLTIKALGGRELGANESLKLWKLLSFPSYFYCEVRLRYRLKFWKKNKMKKYY